MNNERRNRLLKIIDNCQYNRSLIMLVMFIHQHIKSEEIINYLIKNEIVGTKLASCLMNDFKGDFQKFLKVILEK